MLSSSSSSHTKLMSESREEEPFGMLSVGLFLPCGVIGEGLLGNFWVPSVSSTMGTADEEEMGCASPNLGFGFCARGGARESRGAFAMLVVSSTRPGRLLVVTALTCGAGGCSAGFSLDSFVSVFTDFPAGFLCRLSGDKTAPDLLEVTWVAESFHACGGGSSEFETAGSGRSDCFSPETFAGFLRDL